MMTMGSADIQGMMPSVEKYGTLLLQQGFTQHAHSVRAYLVSLKLHSTEILFLQVLESFRREEGQEVFPATSTLAQLLGISERQVRNISKRLVELGLIEKYVRFTLRSQTTSGYSLDPLYRRVAAWLDPEVAEAQAQEAAAFKPVDRIDQAALELCQDSGLADVQTVKQCSRRLRRRWAKLVQFSATRSWADFEELFNAAIRQTQARAQQATASGGTFGQILPYFFSALDWAIKRFTLYTNMPTRSHAPETQPIQADSPSGRDDRQGVQSSRTSQPASTHQPSQPITPEVRVATVHREFTYQPSSSIAPEARAEKPVYPILNARAAQRLASEQEGRMRRRPLSAALRAQIEAVSLTFNDEQLNSSLRQITNLLIDSRISEETMLALIGEARRETSQHQIKRQTPTGKFNRMPYFFAGLKRRIEEICQSQEQMRAAM